ncbi:MAG: universal stress protein [Gemmatimonadota bacterium]|jgi:nucleotide-binding universal stress UspA family protein
MSLLVALDFTDVTDDQLLIVARLAAPNREIYLLHVAEPDPSFVGFDAGPDEVRDQVAREFQQEHERIQALADRLREAGFNAKALLVQGPTVTTILAEADKLNAEAIVVGSHGHGKLYDFAVGSVSSEVIRKSKVPVLVVPSK